MNPDEDYEVVLTERQALLAQVRAGGTWAPADDAGDQEVAGTSGDGAVRVVMRDRRVISVVVNLAAGYQAMGELEQAIPLFEATLADRERVLGPDHPDTLVSRNNLPVAYRKVGDLGRAIALFEATLADSERVLGPDHPLTKTIRSSLDKARLT